MAKYDVKFGCGHTETVELFGKGADRERKIAYWEQQGECSECYKKRMNALQAKSNDRLASLNLPKLEGSEKQISWAKDIRSAMAHNDFATLQNIRNADTAKIEALKKTIEENPNHPQGIKFAKYLSILEETSAKWFIEHR